MSSMDVPADRPVSVPATPAAVVKPTYITWVTLAFMTTASVASLRSAPTMAVYGLTCVFLYIVPAIVFLLPQSLVAAELASGWTGGIFRWVSEGISAKWGLLAVWCQFAMTIFYYPTLLGFVASTLAYVFNPDLADNGIYTGIVIVIVFWSGVFLSARGGVGGIAQLASSGLLVGTLIPAQELSLTAGVMQAFDAFFAYFDLQKLVPIVAIALVCASVGGMLTWLSGPSKGLLLIARSEGYLPPFFQRQNENEVAVNILAVQGGVTTVIALLYALVPSVSSAYWILSVMTTQVYLVMYLLMFVAARNLRRDQPDVERGYTAPVLGVLCVVGFLASAAAIVIGFVPPSQFESGNAAAYIALILAGTGLIGLLPPYLFLRARKPSWKSGEPEVTSLPR